MDPEEAHTPGSNVQQAEQSVVGAAITSRQFTDIAVEVIDPHELYQPAHQTILTTAYELAGEGLPVDPTSVLHRLTTNGAVQRTGGGNYLHTLLAQASLTADQLRYHARIVNGDAQRRRYLTAGHQVVQLATRPEWCPDTSPDSAVEAIEKAGRENQDGDTPVRVDDALMRWIDNLERGDELTVPTGWSDLNRMLHIHPGDLVVIAGRPGHGKTLGGIGLATHTALHTGKPALLVSLEMTMDEVMARVLASETRTPLEQLTQGGDDMGEDTWGRISELRQRVSETPLWIDEIKVATLGRLRSRLRWLNRRGQLPGVMVVDYLQLMTAPQAERREQEVAALSRGLKLMAMEFDVAVVALAQLNRASEQRADHTPTLADLRESGSMEQDANAVLLLHAPSVRDPAERPGEVDLHVAKNRQGRTGIVTCAWQPHYARFTDMAAM